ncbi:MAG: hypothetical protein H9W81_01110 [Enterococcus sp.]|nr:hypothetical protein [Enterococcus sp.]
MVKEFTPSDLKRMKEAEEEKVELNAFYNERLRQFLALTNPADAKRVIERSRQYPFRVVNLLEPKVVLNSKAQEVEVFALETSIGGDQFGSDYEIYYLPTEFVFNRKDWTNKYLFAMECGWDYTPLTRGHRHAPRR